VATPKQIAANRLNSLFSTGPRTAVGKAAASKNAIKHGIFCGVPVLPALGETPADWGAHRDAVVAALAPDGKAELDLAERFALLSWRSARAAKFEAATATVALQPAAALLANPATGPDDPLADLRADRQTAEARTEAVVARRAAEACPKAIALLTGLANRADDEPVDPDVAEAVWRSLCEAAGLPPGPGVQELLLRFWTGPGGTRTGSEPFWEYTGWTVDTVGTALAFVAAEGGHPPDRLAAAAAAALAAMVNFWLAKAAAADGAVGRAVGARQAAAVEAAMRAADRGPAELDLALRYEGHVTREMEAVLRQLAMVRALRGSRAG
jgi:hypothetical protein